MNNKQKSVIWVDITLFALMGLFPSWVQASPVGNSAIRNMGLGFLLSPPDSPRYYTVHLNYSQLLMHWVMVIVVAGVLIVVLR